MCAARRPRLSTIVSQKIWPKAVFSKNFGERRFVEANLEGAVAAQGVVAEHLKSGTLRGIVASTKMPEFPQIPTLPQLGYKQNLIGVWSAFFTPAGVPTGSFENADRRTRKGHEGFDCYFVPGKSRYGR